MYITCRNFTAHVEALAYFQPVNWNKPAIYALGMAGAQSAVKAIWANLLQGHTAAISQGLTSPGSYMQLWSQNPRDWRTWLAHIPAAATSHLVLLPRLAFYRDPDPTFLLLPKTEDRAPYLFWRYLSERCDFPIHRSWAPGLWDASMGQRTPLKTLGSLTCAYHCEPRYSDIQAWITQNVRAGRLTVGRAGHA